MVIDRDPFVGTGPDHPPPASQVAAAFDAHVSEVACPARTMTGVARKVISTGPF